jgi:ribosomal small subunit protein bTHX
MGKGDPRTKRGKIIRGSHGNARPKTKKLKTVLKAKAAAGN